jgi:hypothetical protein
LYSSGSLAVNQKKEPGPLNIPSIYDSHESKRISIIPSIGEDLMRNSNMQRKEKIPSLGEDVMQHSTMQRKEKEI